MSKANFINAMKRVLADSYTLYLKTQNYHWHVRGPSFQSLHLLFEGQYTELTDAVDTIAERILTLGERAPATFKAFLELTSIAEGRSDLVAAEMVKELMEDQDNILISLNEALAQAQAINDEGSVSLLGERIAVHEKNRWMLKSSL